MKHEKAAAREKLKEDFGCLSDEDRDTFFRSMEQFGSVLRKLEAYQERQKAEA